MKALIADHQKLLAFIDQCDDADKLRQLIANARKPDARPIADAAFRKLISIVPGELPGTLEHDFWTTINAFEHVLTQERGKTTRLSRTRQKVARLGVTATLQDWAVGAPTDGFRMLIERDMPELTGEAIVLRHQGLFSEDAKNAARQRLLDAGVDLEKLSTL